MHNTEQSTDPWLRKVKALLAKAASTDYEEEAESLTAKAQELISRHAIDEALVQGDLSSGSGSEIISRKVMVDPPYSRARASLLGAIARANDSQTVLTRLPDGRTECTLVGHRSDLDSTMLLFPALSRQAAASMLRARPHHDGLRGFRRGFLLGFAGRIGERLRQARASAVDEAVRTTGEGVVVALRDRSAAVEDAVRELFPWLRSAATSSSSWSGVSSGRAAAEHTPLGHAAITTQRALGR